MGNRHLLVDLLAALFGIGAWVAINGLWVELPLLVAELPEGWNLPSYLSVIIQIANVGPIAYTLLLVLVPSLRPHPVVYGVLATGCLATLLLAFFWDRTTYITGVEHSTALLILVFFLALVDCTSSVLFLPYMAVWRTLYLPSYLVGEGFSGLLPALVALLQGAGGSGTCVARNVTDDSGNTTTILVPEELHPLFSVTDFFFFLFAMMVASATAFTLLNHLPMIQHERASVVSSILENSHLDSQLVVNSPNIIGISMTQKQFGLYLATQCWACLLANGVLPSIQSYSCGPYGNVTYHLAATLSALANPVAALLTLVLPRARPWVIYLLVSVGSLVGGYVLATATLSPTPPLVGTTAGEALVVTAWVVFVGVMTYVRVEIANLLRLRGGRALFWSGGVSQLGSAVGAVTTFLIINVYNLLTPYYPCS